MARIIIQLDTGERDSKWSEEAVEYIENEVQEALDAHDVEYLDLRFEDGT